LATESGLPKVPTVKSRMELKEIMGDRA